MHVRRRRFLMGAGGLALTLPFLSRVRAGGGGPKLKRLIVVSSPYGHPRPAFFPADETRDAVAISARAQRTALASMPGDPSPVFGRAAWGDRLEKALLLDGIDGGASIGHQKSMPLTGWATGALDTLDAPSVDQIIADKAGLYATTPAFPTVHLALGKDGQTHDGDGISYRLQSGSAVTQPEVLDPSALWQIALKSLVIEGGPEAFEALRARRLRVSDQVLGSYRDLRQDARLSSAERDRLDQYMEHLHGLEDAIESAQYGGCTPSSQPDNDYADETDRMQRQPQQIVDIVAQLLKCEVTRVVTISMGSSSMTYRNLGITGHQHALTHQYEHWEDGGWLADISRFHGELMASLVAQLDEVEDPHTGRTYLDNSLVVWTSDMGTAFNHWGIGMPVALFGGRGVIDRGAIIDFRSPAHGFSFDERDSLLGVNYGGVLVSLCRAFGLAPEDYEYGQEGIGAYAFSGAMAGAFGGDAAYTDFAHGNKRNPLPELFV